MELFFSSYGIEIVVSMIAGVLVSIFGRIIYFSFFKKKKWKLGILLSFFHFLHGEMMQQNRRNGFGQ